MTGRGLSVTGAALLLLSPLLYEAGSALGDRGLLPQLFPPPPPSRGCIVVVVDTRFHPVPAALFAAVHLAVVLAFWRSRPCVDVASLAALLPFVAAQREVLGRLLPQEEFAPLLWISILGPPAAVAAAIGLSGGIRAAAAFARLSTGLLLLQDHALIWTLWKANPWVAGAWTGLVGGLLIAAGELLSSRIPPASPAHA